eukprot:TRINITY_DN1088_c0_g1_i2.p1 TRINITY_DN1088_c0_g1~~TRINITY_DN1088_c0_g1_i2.p1  ORF type:complete len:471 (+),score=123.14 TRINITY_DN1088_c0_g1_i2:38-1414(+)
MGYQVTSVCLIALVSISYAVYKAAPRDTPAVTELFNATEGLGLAQQPVTTQQQQVTLSPEPATPTPTVLGEKGSLVITAYWSQDPWDVDTPQYTTATFVYMALYCVSHGYRYRFYTAPSEPPKEVDNPSLPPDCKAKEYCRHGKRGGCHKRACVGPNGCMLHPVWCKVKAVRQSLVDFPDAPFTMMLDTDAIIQFEFYQNDLAEWVTEHLKAKPISEAPLVFHQQNPTWWHVYVGNHNNSKNAKNITYKWVINTGTYLVGNTGRGRELIDTWWNSSVGDYKENPLLFHYRDVWPWEQDRAMALANEWQLPGVQVVPTTEQVRKLLWRERFQHPGSCLAASPSFRCIVNHFCSDLDMKIKWGGRIMYFVLAQMHTCTTGKSVNLTVPAGDAGAAKPFFPQTYLMEQTPKWCPAFARDIPLQYPEVLTAAMGAPESYNASIDLLKETAKAFGKHFVKVLS